MRTPPMAFTTSDLIEFEKLPVFEFVKRKHPHLAKEKVESDVMIYLFDTELVSYLVIPRILINFHL